MSRQFLVPLLLPADPAVAMEAATKQYVDAKVGTGSNFGEWMWSTSITEPPSGSEIRVNHATMTSVTRVWVRYITADGIDTKSRLLAQSKSGARFYVQDKDNSANYATFDLTADATDDGTYVDMPVAYYAHGGTIPAQRVIASFISVPSGGGTGADEVFVGTSDPGATYELWYDPDATSGEAMAEMQLWTWEGPTVTRYGSTGMSLVDGQISTNTSPSTATELYISKLDTTGMIDWSRPIEESHIGDLIYLQHASNAESWHRYQITGVPTIAPDNVWTIPVTTESGSTPGTAPPVGDLVYVVFPPTEALDQPAADLLYVNLNGDTMTGPLIVTGGGELDLTSTAHHLQLGASTGGNLAFDANEIQSRNNDAANVLNLNPHGGNVWIGTDGVAAGLHLRGPFPLGTPLDFYSGGQRIASMFSYGSSFPTDLVIQTIAPSGNDLALQAVGAVTFTTGGAGEVGRFSGTTFLVGKTAAGITTTGLQVPPDGSLGYTNSLNQTNLILNKSVLSAGHIFASFRNTNNEIGSITRNASQAAVLYNTTSDYRLKVDHGPIEGALARINLLIPRRVHWITDPDQVEVDGFFAHEVAEVVPEAVTGEKDAVADADDESLGQTEGQLIPQQLDATKLIPLLTAALQEAVSQIETLTARVTALEGA